MSTTEEDVQSHMNMVSSALSVSDTKSKQIADETAKDTELQCVIENIKKWMACRFLSTVLPHQR